MIRGLCWLVYVVAVAALTLHALFGGGHTWNDHLLAMAVMGCFGVYGLLGLGALVAREGPGLGRVMVLLGMGVALLYPLFWALDAGADRGTGLLWWLVLASQPAYAFCFWSFLLLVPHTAWVWLRGGRPGWPGRWLLVPLALSVWGLIWVLGPGAQLREHRVVVASMPGVVRLVHLSDFHYGPDLPERQLRAQLARAMATQPDLVVVTGDLVDPFSDDPGDHDGLLEALGALPVPVLICPGNHDTPHWPVFRRELEAIGATVLDDEATVIHVRGAAVQVLGAGFRWGGVRASTEALLEAHPPLEQPGARLLISHEPRVAERAPADSFDLALAGHTHGGVPALDFLGWRVSALRLRGWLDQGFFDLPGGPLYVSEGSWIAGMPPRIGTAPEIAVFELGP
jgi:predicted MPP superfamily phosphohydrolase